jgi:hypothetical protein
MIKNYVYEVGGWEVEKTTAATVSEAELETPHCLVLACACHLKVALKLPKMAIVLVLHFEQTTKVGNEVDLPRQCLNIWSCQQTLYHDILKKFPK